MADTLLTILLREIQDFMCFNQAVILRDRLQVVTLRTAVESWVLRQVQPKDDYECILWERILAAHGADETKIESDWHEAFYAHRISPRVVRVRARVAQLLLKWLLTSRRRYRAVDLVERSEMRSRHVAEILGVGAVALRCPRFVAPSDEAMLFSDDFAMRLIGMWARDVSPWHGPVRVLALPDPSLRTIMDDGYPLARVTVGGVKMVVLFSVEPAGVMYARRPDDRLFGVFTRIPGT
jgi:hypothetical protein